MGKSHPSWVRGLKLVVVFGIVVVCVSHPSWVRGLKLIGKINTKNEYCVAPLVGAWIETKLAQQQFEMQKVAPLVGAWIETFTSYIQNVHSAVAPLVGAWIETMIIQRLKAIGKSHPSWVRGLKLSKSPNQGYLVSRTPRGCVD